MQKLAGFSLLETMISLSLISLFVLAESYQQISNFYNANVLLDQSIANASLNYFMTRMRYVDDRYLSNELATWNEMNQALLTNGKGSIELNDNKKILKLKFNNGDINACKKNCLEILL